MGAHVATLVQFGPGKVMSRIPVLFSSDHPKMLVPKLEPKRTILRFVVTLTQCEEVKSTWPVYGVVNVTAQQRSGGNFHFQLKS